MPRDQQRFNVRRTNVTACLRCRSRKQRCDQKIPACSACERVGVECVSADSDGLVVPRSYVKSLEDHVAYLETQLAALTPPSIPTRSDAYTGSNSGFPGQAATESDDWLGRIADSCSQVQTPSHVASHANGLGLLHSLLSESVARLAGTPRHSNGHPLLDELPPDALPAIPRRETADKLADIYFEHCDFFSPIFASKHEFLKTLEPLYEQETLSPGLEAICKFRSFMVFSTSVLLLNRVDSSIPASKAEKYFHAACALFTAHPQILCTRDFEHLKNLVLITQYCCFASYISAAWHILGVATRLSIELNLHRKSIQTRPGDPELNEQRWLFWAIYTFERNICVIMRRPYSFPDHCIETPLPVAPLDEPPRAFALHLLKHRLLESEIYATLYGNEGMHSFTGDMGAWREDMLQKLRGWHSSVPIFQQSTHLAPTDIFDGSLYNTVVLLYYPSRHFPSISSSDLTVLARNATDAINCYSRTFRAGELRFFWRTAHNLFRSGVAIVYCYNVYLNNPFTGLRLESVIASINSCSSSLWGMVERYPAGRAYRDIFDKLANSVLKRSERLTDLNITYPMNAASETNSSFVEVRFDADMVTDFSTFGFDGLLWGSEE